MSLKSVKVPKDFEPLFQEAENFMSSYFKDLKLEPESGKILVGEERYVLVRADSLAINFYNFLMNMYPTMDDHEAHVSSSKVIFDMGHSIGKSDANCCLRRRSSADAIEKLSAGPLHFAYTGWAFVEILETSSPIQDDDFFLLYDHPNTFEADSWLKTGKKTDFCTCHMNAGYSSGWSSVSFDMELRSQEILCRAKGDKSCRFIMARPHKLEEKIQKYKDENSDIFK